MNSEHLVGAWSLDSFVITRSDGTRVSPYGENARGTLLYSANGWVSAVLSRHDRGPFGRSTLEAAHEAPTADKVRAFDGYMSYSGRYVVKGDVVEHTVVLSLVPTMIGRTLSRKALRDGRALILSYDVQSSRGLQHYELRWSPAKDGGQ